MATIVVGVGTSHHPHLSSAIQRLNDAEGPAPEVSIKIDAGGLAARRLLRPLEGEESGRRT